MTASVKHEPLHMFVNSECSDGFAANFFLKQFVPFMFGSLALCRGCTF
jgi:hypothetical protein